MKKNTSHFFLLLFFLFGFSIQLWGMENIETKNDIVSVIRFGIKNDGSVIGPELNRLVKKNYGKTLYFPAGTYNLSEPIVLPFDYTKNVNIVFDKNALIKSDSKLDALLKIGYTEMSTPDVTHRRFSYIEGGMFDCSNVDNGIMVNGLKQLVSLKYISLFKGRKTHIRISVTDDFKGTGSSDTKIDNITIQGISSNENVYGIYIDKSCCDCKISNTFIYGTKYGIVTKSAGHILNNVHILSMNTGGGLNLGANNFRQTEGIRLESGGFFVFNEIYFDTIDKSIVIEADQNPTLILDKNIFYSYLKNFGTSFLYKDPSSVTPFQVKVSNSIIEVSKKGYKIFDINPSLISNDTESNFSFANCALRNPGRLNTLDLSLAQRMTGKRHAVVSPANKPIPANEWIPIGAILASEERSLLKLDLTKDCSVELDISFRKGENPLIITEYKGSKTESFKIGYVVKDSFCVLLVKSEGSQLFPAVTDLLGTGLFMPTPSKETCYSLSDYGITEEAEIKPLRFCAKTYTNPLKTTDGADIHVADPFVYKAENLYYLTGTTTSPEGEGFIYYTSSDLISLYRKPENHIGDFAFWAPEVKYYKGKYYMTYSCFMKKYNRMLTCLAVSENPSGPFVDLHTPWFDLGYSAIDADIFVDDDGTPYAYFSKNENHNDIATGELYVAKLKEDLSGLVGKPVFISRASQPWEKVNWGKNRCNEGAYVFKKNGTYYMTYSANDTGYEHYGVGISYADNPLGPWKKSDENPLMTTDLSKGISAPGHNSIVVAPNGDLYMIYHRHADASCKKPNWDRIVCMDRLFFDKEGKLHTAGPSAEPQQVGW